MCVMKYLFLTLLIVTVKSEVCPGTYRVDRDHLNKRLVGHVLYDKKVDGIHPCVYDCMFLGACKSFNYITVNKSCEINNISSVLASGEFVAEQGTIFADITEFPQAMVGSCANHKCGYYKRCYPTGSSHVCADIDCGSLPYISNGILSLDTLSKTFGGTASVKCNSGYYSKTSSIACKASGEWEETICVRASDCYDIGKIQSNSTSGIHIVQLWQSDKKMSVYCDMETDQGGWTVFQNRFDGSVDFYRNFSEYENGFGDLKAEFWLGLSFIQEITSQGESDLRVDVEAPDGSRGFETFTNFYLTNGPDYALHVGSVIGSLNMSEVPNFKHFGLYHSGMKFSTFDNKVDLSGGNCAIDSHGAWWYNACHAANLNGWYMAPGTDNPLSMSYFAFSQYIPLKSSKMMMRRK